MGITKHALANATQSQAIFRVGRGCYAIANASQSRIAEVFWNGRATCVTALKSLGLPTLEADGRVHLALRPGRNLAGNHAAPPRKVVRHFNSRIATCPHDAKQALDASYLCLEPNAQLVAIDAALNRGLLKVEEIADFSVTSAKRRHWLLRNADPRAQSPIETLARVAMTTAGLRVQTQVQIPGVGRVDFLVHGTVIVEVDGRTYHSDERQFAEDRRRDRAATLRGFRVLRFTFDDVRWAPDEMVAQISQLLDVLKHS